MTSSPRSMAQPDDGIEWPSHLSTFGSCLGPFEIDAHNLPAGESFVKLGLYLLSKTCLAFPDGGGHAPFGLLLARWRRPDPGEQRDEAAEKGSETALESCAGWNAGVNRAKW